MPKLLDEAVLEEVCHMLLVVIVKDTLVSDDSFIEEGQEDRGGPIHGLALARPEGVVEHKDDGCYLKSGGACPAKVGGQVLTSLNHPPLLGPVMLANIQPAVCEVLPDGFPDPA